MLLQDMFLSINFCLNFKKDSNPHFFAAMSPLRRRQSRDVTTNPRPPPPAGAVLGPLHAARVVAGHLVRPALVAGAVHGVASWVLRHRGRVMAIMHKLQDGACVTHACLHKAQAASGSFTTALPAHGSPAPHRAQAA